SASRTTVPAAMPSTRCEDRKPSGIAALARRDGLARAGALPGSATCAVTGPADIARRVAVLAADLANWADGVSGGGQRLTEADDAARRRIAGS
uniref:hypothetical protein n=1 Tax=Mycolicibacterium fallax TaxID=1793 RepID=UPI0021F3B499